MNTRQRMMMGLLLAGGSLAASAVPAQLQWRFDSAAATAVPEVNTAGLAGAQARVAPGTMSIGWQREMPALGGAGLWDLGRNGTVRVSLPGGLGPQVVVEVRQWIDAFIYSDCAAVSLEGATLKSSAQVEDTTGDLGGWVVQRTTWEVASGGAAKAVQISGAESGAVIDQVTVVAAAVPAQPLELSIRPGSQPGQLELSWPESAGAAGVESAAEPSGGWESVSAQPQLVAGRYAVNVSGSESARFFRLKR